MEDELARTEAAATVSVSHRTALAESRGDRWTFRVGCRSRAWQTETLTFII